MLEIATAPGLRPLNTTAIVDAAVEHVRADPNLYYGISAPVMLPLAGAGLYFFDLVRDYRGAPDGYRGRVLASAAALTLLVHLRFLAQGALAWALERRLRGEEATVGQAWAAAARRGLTLTFSGALLWGFAAAGAFIFVLPALVPFALLVLATPVAMAEDRSPLGTVRRAAELGWLEIGRACAIAFLLFLGTAVLAVGTGYAIQLACALMRSLLFVDVTLVRAVLDWKNPTFTFGAALAGLALLEPVKTLAFALLYVDRRVRTEGFDLRRKVQLILERERSGKAVSEEAAP